MTKSEMAMRDAEFNIAIYRELERARLKFPSPNNCMTALVEEMGELAQALLKHAAGKGPIIDIWNEAVQVAAMACRVAVESDPAIFSLNYEEPSWTKCRNCNGWGTNCKECNGTGHIKEG